MSCNKTDKDEAGRRALKLFSKKWSLLTIYALFDGPRRLSELQREIDGVSQKMLIQTLRELEHMGLIDREVHPVVPPHVEYRLTKAGTALHGPLVDLCRWGNTYLSDSPDS